MRIGPDNFIRVFQVFQHALQFGFAVVFDHRFSFVFSLQVEAHTGGIRFRVKLCTDHIFIKPQSHNRSFIRNMRSAFFDAKQGSTHFIQQVMVGLNDLVIPAVNCIKRIQKPFKNGLIIGIG